jgi:hypothetical protein
MTATEWAGFGVAIMTLTAGFAAFVRWMVNHYLAELKPNSGSSLRDSIDRLEHRVDKIYEILCDK